jgi:cytoskeletal protein CcmA (bactofilin family)
MLEVKRKPASHSLGQSSSTARTHLSELTGTQAGGPTAFLPSSSSARTAELKDFQSKLPVIIGEVHFKGMMPVDGSIAGQIGSASGLAVKQRSSIVLQSQPELNGELSFKNMVRVNGHIAGSVSSRSGTLLVDTSAVVEANINVAVAVISGTVRGEIVAHERVELGPASKIYGNIWTRSLVIKDGAIFEGVCRMIEEEQKAC